MLRRIVKLSVRNNNCVIRNCSQFCENINKNTSLQSTNYIQTVENSLHESNNSVLEPLNEDISHVSTYLKPTFNFAAYINKSETLQELLKLGVHLYKLEKNEEIVQFILGLKFENIKDHILFLNDLGIETEKIGEYLTKNPLILKEDVENLKIRINYLKYKKFTDDMILRIVQANCFWLTHSTQQIDEHLGFLQNHFGLSGNEVRLIATKSPKLITYPISKVKLNTFVLKEEMGFTQEELKKIILHKPSILMKGQHRILQAFEYLHRSMNIPLERIVEEPEILTCRKKRLMERHLFLVKLGRDQFDPKKPNYVALTTLVSETDSYFSTEIAKSSIQAYNAYLKSL
ncbi:hypothetical protein NQ314_007174 [Rhamnusium bicolor]|uniref:Transcription termination factor 3, mitochondrial n=1 Tax=Rhamnusium bicolor TaxID=1586634 RepID=A0AAV8YSG6_9CUCU|nr:hypothetical protein NQ314_007174 [Rhamnusium bicolor]